jgi:hypothetical protein
MLAFAVGFLFLRERCQHWPAVFVLAVCDVGVLVHLLVVGWGGGCLID